jgi:peptidyl-prolyl cis-trans isomerase A (cyclophilin A)
MRSLLALVLSSLLIHGCNSCGANAPATDPVPGSSGAAAAPGAPAAAGKPSPALLDPSLAKDQAPETYRAKFTTTKGVFVVEVQRALAPLGADRFFNLVKSGFFDGTKFFRVVDGFMVQWGIHGTPSVAKAWVDANIKDDPVKSSNTRGAITFATAGPNTRTTQVFINFADNARLDKSGFASFGKVVEGMDVVDSLYKGYGEGAPRGRGPEQGRMQAEGNAYLDKDFPQLDAVKHAEIAN